MEGPWIFEACEYVVAPRWRPVNMWTHPFCQGVYSIIITLLWGVGLLLEFVWLKSGNFFQAERYFCNAGCAPGVEGEGSVWGQYQSIPGWNLSTARIVSPLTFPPDDLAGGWPPVITDHGWYTTSETRKPGNKLRFYIRVSESGREWIMCGSKACCSQGSNGSLNVW